jgi:hypothetical protein
MEFGTGAGGRALKNLMGAPLFDLNENSPLKIPLAKIPLQRFPSIPLNFIINIALISTFSVWC